MGALEVEGIFYEKNQSPMGHQFIQSCEPQLKGNTYKST